nr:TM2 domain-containing protein [Corynebacterium lactis]
MTNPYGNYNKDGLPVTGGNPWDAPSTPQPYGGVQNHQPAFPQPQANFNQTPGSAGFNSTINIMNNAPSGPVTSPKSKVAAILLCFFLGGIGAHNFYLGHSGRGIAQLLLTIFGWATAIIFVGFFLLAAVSIWVLVDFVMLIIGSGSYKYDSEGRLLN